MTWQKSWGEFRETQPFRSAPFNKRNWGHTNHSLCSFYGKLKPAISHFLVKSFSSEGDNVFDCFTGSGTVPFEAALTNRHAFGLDINPISVVLSRAKVSNIDLIGIQSLFGELKQYLQTALVNDKELIKAQTFGYNKTLIEYYHPDTLQEIIKARQFFRTYKQRNANYYFVLACLLHILHGNRPYALSRRSHPITPYAPTGDFENKSLAGKLYEKIDRAYNATILHTITPGIIFEGDVTDTWPAEIDSINAIITSPPFFESTKYYLVNWLRSWFLGWEIEDFDREKMKFVDTLQKKNFDVYDIILKQGKERLVKDGVMVFHLGKSSKKDMATAITPYAKRYFKNVEIYNEDVTDIESHGVSDKGSVTSHQYLVMH